MGTREREYPILKLRNMCARMNQKVNIVAVIFELGFPKTTRGTDYCCALRVIDETHHQHGVAVNIFAENAGKLPRVAAVGDVIQLGHVVVREHRGELNAVFDKRFSSFALYEGKDGDDFTPYQVSSKFQPRDQDKLFIDKLRKWLANFQLREDSSGFPMFREVKEGININLACKILHCCEVAKDEWFIFAWDGTDAPPNAICSKLEDELNFPLPLQLEPLPLSGQVLHTWPTMGSILRITLSHGVEKNHFHLLSIDKWVKFVNIRIEVYGGLWHGVFTPCTKLRYTPAEDSLIVQREKLYDERLSLEVGKFPSPSSLTVVSAENVRPVTLRLVLSNPMVAAKYKCIVRVVAASPCQAEEILSPDGKYKMQLTLEDPTARIQASVKDKDAEVFFDDFSDIEKLRRKLNKLLGIAESVDNSIVQNAPRNPPWIVVCLKSLNRDMNDVWSCKRFSIFDTKIVGDTG